MRSDTVVLICFSQMNKDVEYLFLCLAAVAVTVCELLLSSSANIAKPKPAGTALKKLAHQELLKIVQSSIVIANPGNVPSILQWKDGLINCGLFTDWSLSSTGNEVWLHVVMWVLETY